MIKDGRFQYLQPYNARAWALCTKQGNRWHVRRVVWGRLLAREEKRDGETIKRVSIFFREPQR